MANAINTPLISVISITLNDRDGLKRTVESLQSQDGALNYEHIVVDGLSDYDVAGLLAELDSHARLHQGRDAGLYDAMNRGTDLARGDYLLYLNSGDTLATSGVLTSVAAELIRERPDFLYGDSLERQLAGAIEEKAAQDHSRAPFGMFTHHQSMVFSREIVSKEGIRYNLDYPIAADYDFILRVLDHSKKIMRHPGLIATFSAGGISQVKHHAGRREQFLVRKLYFKSSAFAARVFLMQIAVQYLRGLSPKLYWRMRASFVKVFR